MTTPAVAMIVPSANRQGGGDIWLEQLLTHLPAEGIAPTVIFEADGELVRYAADLGLGSVILPRRAPGTPGAVHALSVELAEVLTQLQPDVTVCWSPRAQLYGSAAHQLAGMPGQTMWVQHVIPSRYWLHRAASSAPAGLVICVSSAVERRQRELYPRSRTRVVHPGISQPQAVRSRQEARERLACVGPGPVVGLVGRVEPWKGQDIAVRMLADLAIADARLVLIGERHSPTWPGFGAYLRDLARDLQVADRVLFTGHRGDASALLPAFDVLVCASREEGFGLAIIEAMAANVPIVATRCGGPQDILEHQRTGLLIAPDDPAELASAVRVILRHPDMATAMANRARSAWRERFTGRRSATVFASVLNEMANLTDD